MAPTLSPCLLLLGVEWVEICIHPCVLALLWCGLASGCFVVEPEFMSCASFASKSLQGCPRVDRSQVVRREGKTGREQRGG